ncbi:MAG: carbonic anhydrase [Actinomycetota bacterium]
MTDPLTPEAVWADLAAGNERFAAGRAAHPHADAGRLAEVVGGQHPHAAVLGCADSRVPAELVFDQGVGDLFVVRTAGMVVDDIALGSLQYAVDVVGVPLLVVLGHESCGAVHAARAVAAGAASVTGPLGAVAAGVLPEALTAPARDADEIQARGIAARVRAAAPIAAAVAEGRVEVVTAMYSLATGEVRRLD